MHDINWYRRWCGHLEPDWDQEPIHPGPVGYAWEVDGHEAVVKSTAWADPYRRAVEAAYRWQYGSDGGSLSYAAIPDVRICTGRYHRDIPDWFDMADTAGEMTACLSRYTEAVLCNRKPDVPVNHPQSCVTLRWYDHSPPRPKPWTRRCCVWSFVRDPTESRRVTPRDEDWAARSVPVRYPPSEREYGPPYQVRFKHHFIPASTLRDAVYATHHGSPDWVPDRNAIHLGLMTAIADGECLGPDGVPIADNPQLLDRLLNVYPDLELWAEVARINQNTSGIRYLSTMIDSVIMTSFRRVVVEI